MFVSEDYLVTIVKSMFSIAILYTFTKIIGKKQIAQLNLFDYIVGITIGSIAAEISLKAEVSIIEGVISLAIWELVPLMISLINIKSIKFRGFSEGTPTVLIQNGRILEKNLKKSRFTVNDLLEEMRVKGYFNVADVKYAILETNGQVSVLEKSKQFCMNLIIDGEVIDKNLEAIKVSKTWLLKELEKRGISDTKGVFFASADENKKLFVELKKND